VRHAVVTKSATDSTDDEEIPQGTARLFDMDTREVSLVDVPANKRRLLVVKRADGSEETVETGPVTPDATAKNGVAALADQFEVRAPLAAALGQVEKVLSTESGETTMSQPTTPTQAAPAQTATVKAAEAPATTIVAPAPVAKANGSRLERLKSVRQTLKSALAELRGGQVSLEKFDSAAKDLQQVISECEVTKLLESVRAEKTAKMANGLAGFDTRSTSPSNPNMGAGVQPDASAVAGAEAVFGDGVPAGVADLVKGLQSRLDTIEKRNAQLEKKNANLQTEVVSLKKFRDAPSALEEGEADEILHGGEDEVAPSEDEAWPTDMAAEREELLATESDED
jgi:hypothetical protein